MAEADGDPQTLAPAPQILKRKLDCEPLADAAAEEAGRKNPKEPRPETTSTEDHGGDHGEEVEDGDEEEEEVGDVNGKGKGVLTAADKGKGKMIMEEEEGDEEDEGKEEEGDIEESDESRRRAISRTIPSRRLISTTSCPRGRGGGSRPRRGRTSSPTTRRMMNLVISMRSGGANEVNRRSWPVALLEKLKKLGVSPSGLCFP